MRIRKTSPDGRNTVELVLRLWLGLTGAANAPFREMHLSRQQGSFLNVDFDSKKREMLFQRESSWHRENFSGGLIAQTASGNTISYTNLR
jgi:hypothetical protein